MLVLLAGQPLKSNIFGDLANRLRQDQDLIGNGIGKAVGVKLSGVLETATAPALDNAASKFTEVVNGAAGKLDQSLASENQSIDTIAQQNIGRLDQVANTRLDQLDGLIDTRLKQVQAEANTLLNREALIVDTALKQENTIANNALDRVQTISDQTLSRLEGMEGDAFNRIDSALQDQVPVAASQVAHEFVIGAIVVACIVALFGLAGIHLWKSFQLSKSGDSSTWQTLRSGFVSFSRTFPQELAVFVIPTLLIAAAVLGGYEGYLRSTRVLRVSRLENAGILLESAGDYKAGAEMRRRALSVDGGSNSRRQEFYYQADLWLADFTQKNSVDVSDLVRRLAVLESNGLINEDNDLRAASLYLRANISGAPDTAAIAHYRETVLNGNSSAKAPFLGKLVLMTQIKAELDSAAIPSERVASALKVTQELRALYPNYPNGHLLTAMLLGMQADSLASGEAHDSQKEAVLRKIVSDELSRASMLDPALMRIVRLTTAELPEGLLKDMDEDPRRPEVAVRLSAFASSEIVPLVRTIMASDVLGHLTVDRTILYATRRGIGERKVTRAIAALPTAKPERQAAIMATIAQEFLDIDSYLPAESWLEAARKAAESETTDATLKHQMDSVSQSLVQAKLSTNLATVI